MQNNRGWTLTLGLTLLALAAAALAPALAKQPAPVVQPEADVCVRLGPYECCYKEDGE